MSIENLNKQLREICDSEFVDYQDGEVVQLDGYFSFDQLEKIIFTIKSHRSKSTISNDGSTTYESVEEQNSHQLS